MILKCNEELPAITRARLRAVAIAPAAVVSRDLGELARPFVASVIYGQYVGNNTCNGPDARILLQSCCWMHGVQRVGAAAVVYGIKSTGLKA